MRSPRTATKSSPCSPQLEKPRTQQRRSNAAKKIININKLKKKKEIAQEINRQEQPWWQKAEARGRGRMFALLAVPRSRLRKEAASEDTL